MATAQRTKGQALADMFIRRWVHLAPYGVRTGHPKGDLDLRRPTITKIIREFEANPNPLQVDFEHASLEPHPDGQPIPAAGWIHALQMRDKGPHAGLWGYVYWTQEAADLIRAGKYLYNSPVIVKGKPDGTTNKPVEIQLWNGALTNSPFLKGQQPLAMRDEMPEKENVTTPAVPAKSDLEVLVEQLLALSGMDAEALKKAFAAKGKAVANLLASEVVDGEEEPNKWANSESTKPLLARIDELNAQVNALSTKIAARDQADIESYVDSKIKGGYILDAQKADVIQACKDYGKEYVERVWAAKAVPIGEIVAGGDPKKGNDPAKLDPELRSLFVQSGLFTSKKLDTLFKG